MLRVLLACASLSAAGLAAAESFISTRDGASCSLPFVFEPGQDELESESPHYTPFEFDSCTYAGSRIFEPWCSTGAQGAFTGSWGTCAPFELLHDETEDFAFLFRGEEDGMLVTQEEFWLDAGFTFEMWVSVRGDNFARTANRIIFTSHDAVAIGVSGLANEVTWMLDGLLTMDPADPTAPPQPLVGWQQTGVKFEGGVWKHVALSYDGVSAALYVDGRRMVWQVVTGRLPRQWGKLSLGGDPMVPKATFHGHVDEVRVWGEGRSHRAIVANMLRTQRPADVWRHGLIAYWPMLAPAGMDAHGGYVGLRNVVSPSHLAYSDRGFWPAPLELTLKPLVEPRMVDDNGETILPGTPVAGGGDGAADGNDAGSGDATGGGGGRRLEVHTIGTTFGALVKEGHRVVDDIPGAEKGHIPLSRALGGSEIVFTGGYGGTLAIAAGTPKNLRLKKQGTIEFWVAPEVQNAQNYPFMRVVTKGDSYAVGLKAHTLELWYFLGGRRNSRAGTSTMSDMHHVLDSCRLLPLRWSHVALAFDRSGVSAYIDGVLCAEDPDARGGDLSDSAAGVEVGGSLTEPSAALSGAVDEVRVWNKKRSPADIAALMLDTLYADFWGDFRTSGLLASWSFDEGHGWQVVAAHGEGREDDPPVTRGLVLTGDHFQWRLATSPASLIEGSALDLRPERFAIAFDGLHEAALAAPPQQAPVNMPAEYCLELWFAWHGPNEARTEQQVLAWSPGNFAVALGGVGGSAPGDSAKSLILQTGGSPVEVVVSLTRGVWYHLALSHRKGGRARDPGGGMSVILNGVDIPLDRLDTHMAPSLGASGGRQGWLWFGNDAQGTHPFKGAVHEVRLWGKARSAEEVRPLLFSRLLLDDDDDAHVLPDKGGTDEPVIAYWPLDEGLGRVTVDRSGHAIALNLVPATAAAGPGVRWARATSPIARGPDDRFASGFGLQLGSCAGAMGASHIAVPGAGSLKAKGGYTVELWLNLGSFLAPLKAPGPNQAWPSQPKREPASTRRVIASRAGQFTFGVAQGGGLFLDLKSKHAQSAVAASAADEWDVPYDEWVHVAFSFNKTGAYLMLNGAIAVDTRHRQGVPGVHDNIPLLFGAADEAGTGQASDQLCGRMDEVRVWNQYKAHDEIRANLLATVQAPGARREDKGQHERVPSAISSKADDLVLAYSMDSGWGFELFDDSDNGNRGIIDGPTVPVRDAQPAVPSTSGSAHQWGLSGAPTDDESNGQVSMGYAMRFTGATGGAAQCSKGLREGVGKSVSGFTVQMRLLYFGRNDASRPEEVQPQAILHEPGAASLYIEGNSELSWYLEGVEPAAQSSQASGRIGTKVHLEVSEDWRQLALVFDGSGRRKTVTLVVDSLVVSVMEVHGAFSPTDNRRTNGKLQLGGSMDSPNHAFHGSLDDVAIWSEARTLPQITTEHLTLMDLVPRGGSAGAKNVPETLVAYWQMDDGWGRTAWDATEHGFDCTGTDKLPPVWGISDAPRPGEERMCTTDAVRCEPSFDYRGKTYYGCTGDHNRGVPWCFTNEKRLIWQECASPCWLLPHGGFPGHFTSVGRHAWPQWLFKVITVLLLCCCLGACAGAAVVLKKRGGGGGGGGGSGRCPAYFEVRDRVEDAIEGCMESISNLRGRSSRPTSRPTATQGRNDGPFSFTVGNGATANAEASGYSREYTPDGFIGASDDGYRGGASGEPGPARSKHAESRAEGGVRSSIARDHIEGGNGGASNPPHHSQGGGFQEFQDDML